METKTRILGSTMCSHTHTQTAWQLTSANSESKSVATTRHGRGPGRFASVVALALASQLLLAGQVLANVNVDFDFGSGFGSFSGSGSTMRYYMDGAQTGNGVGVSITGWQARSNTRNFRNRTNSIYNGSSDGMGLSHRESGNSNGIDNAGRYDLIIFEFDELVSLDRIDLGWVGNDYDMTVLAHTGPTDPVLANSTFRYQQNHSKGMTNLGWELVGHYLENDTPNVDVASGIMSSFWAIGAYTSAITDSSRTYGNPDGNSDYFMLRNLAATVADTLAVSEPAGPALLGLALLVLYRRRLARSR